MIFSSIEFIIFFIVFLLALKFLDKFQRNLIIIFSLFFYAFWNISFVLLILYFCLATYIFIKKNNYLKTSIFLIILPLVYFKYSTFLLDILNLDQFNSFAYNGALECMDEQAVVLHAVCLIRRRAQFRTSQCELLFIIPLFSSTLSF